MAVSTNPIITEDEVQEPDYSALQTTNSELNRLLAKRHNKVAVVSSEILRIHENTERVVTNKVAKENEFITKSGKFIPNGTLYHIHYTKDLKQFYMTGKEHNPSTQIIYRKSLYNSDFDYYNSLNKQEVLIIENNIILPTEEDYVNRSFIRYFAKKANDLRSTPFEISADDFQFSSMYVYVSLNWYIKGDKDLILKLNNRQKEIASETIPNIGKLLPDYQYFRVDEKSSPKEAVMDRLGTTTRQSEQSTTQQSQTQQTTTQQAPPTGPPPGVTSGGAGGAGGY